MIRVLAFLLSCSLFPDTLGIVALRAFRWLRVIRKQELAVNHNLRWLTKIKYR